MFASVIIPNWNGEHLLKTCLVSLSNQSFKDFEVIIVDNGSKDNSVRLIKESFPKFKVIQLNKNTGFAYAVNRGIEEAKGELLFLLNNDTECHPDVIKNFVASAKKHPEIGFFAAKMLQFENREKLDSAGDWIDAVGHADHIGRGEKDTAEFNKEGAIFLASGGGMLIRREVLKKIGLFDEDYFAYFEDVDLCLRSQMAGFKGWYEPKAIIYHMHKATSSKNRNLLEYLQFRNMTMTIIKDFPAKLLLKNFNWLKIILVNLNTVKFLATQGHLSAAIKAEAYIIFNIGKILRKRMQVQSKKVVSEDYIIDNFREKKLKFLGFFK